MSLSAREIKEILGVLEESGWEEARLVVGDVTLTVAKGAGGLLDGSGGATAAAPATAAPAAAPAAPDTPASAPEAPAPAPAPSATTAPADVDGELVGAPSVGIFWRAPEPGAAPFVEDGQHVEAGDTLCIVEVMKLMNHVAAPVAGTVAAVHAENGASVEFDAPLFTITPDA